jgi:hypothetical protein
LPASVSSTASTGRLLRTSRSLSFGERPLGRGDPLFPSDFSIERVEFGHGRVVLALQLGGAALVGVGIDLVKALARGGDQGFALLLQLTKSGHCILQRKSPLKRA